jgi:hypothetical protein
MSKISPNNKQQLLGSTKRKTNKSKKVVNNNISISNKEISSVLDKNKKVKKNKILSKLFFIFLFLFSILIILFPKPKMLTYRVGGFEQETFFIPSDIFRITKSRLLDTAVYDDVSYNNHTLTLCSSKISSSACQVIKHVEEKGMITSSYNFINLYMDEKISY